MKTIYEQAKQAAEELIAAAKLTAGDLLVVGCSSSEITGAKIGSDSKPETANEVFSGIRDATYGKGIYLAAQCCEHLNRALVVEADYAEAHGIEVVNAVPQPKAGGSFATAAYKNFKRPVLVEEVIGFGGEALLSLRPGGDKQRCHKQHPSKVHHDFPIERLPNDMSLIYP